MGDTLDARIAFLQRQLHAINIATAEAAARGDAETIVRMQALYRKVAADVEVLKQEAYAADAPADLLVRLDRFGDEVAATGRVLVTAAGDVVGGLASIVKYLPVILLAALVVVGLIYAGKIRKDLQ